MHGRRAFHLAAALALTAVASSALAAASPATVTREPLRDALHAPRLHPRAQGSSSRPAASPAALRATLRKTAHSRAPAAGEFGIASDRYGPAEREGVAATLRSLDHGPELAELTVFVADPGQLREICGAGVLACYFPAVQEMVVSGVNRPIEGVSRELAIAHEYGHHIANARAAGAPPDVGTGMLRWATYERVCQLRRRGRLSTGRPGAGYWRDPGEAFAQAYALLNRPADGVPWDYAPPLEPSAATLAKIHADIAHPWAGLTESRWAGSLAAPAPAKPAAAPAARSGAIGIGAGRAVGNPPWVATRLMRTPLDGPVSVSVAAPAGDRVAVTLRDRQRRRVLARAVTGPEGSAEVSYSNCGADALRVEVRSLDGPAAFEAELSRP